MAHYPADKDPAGAAYMRAALDYLSRCHSFSAPAELMAEERLIDASYTPPPDLIAQERSFQLTGVTDPGLLFAIGAVEPPSPRQLDVFMKALSLAPGSAYPKFIWCTIAANVANSKHGLGATPEQLKEGDDLSLKYPAGATMSLADLFAWTQASVFAGFHVPHARPDEIERSLQQWYARQLAEIVLTPKPGTPYDAQSLARAELVALRSDLRAARRMPGGDALAQAHLAALEVVADQALSARTVIPVTAPSPETK